MERRMSNDAVLNVAISDLDSETERRIPLQWRKSFEQALVYAERAKNIIHADISRKGGKSRKSNTLQELIDATVLENPDLTERQLFLKLRSKVGEGVVTSIDRDRDLQPGEIAKIHFVDEQGTPRTAPVRSLKDRLFRAKAKINSR